MNMEQTGCSETLAYKIQSPGNYPEKSISIFLTDYFLEKEMVNRSWSTLLA